MCAALRKRFPTAHELAYDNYNFFVIGFCNTERTDRIVSLAAQGEGSRPFFIIIITAGRHRPMLSPGKGHRNRFIRLESAATLAKAASGSSLRAAVAHAKSLLPATGRRATMVESVSAKQRPHRSVRK